MRIAIPIPKTNTNGKKNVADNTSRFSLKSFDIFILL